MESKSEELKSAGELVVKGMHQLFEELSDEVHVAESDKRAA